MHKLHRQNTTISPYNCHMGVKQTKESQMIQSYALFNWALNLRRKCKQEIAHLKRRSKLIQELSSMCQDQRSTISNTSNTHAHYLLFVGDLRNLQLGIIAQTHHKHHKLENTIHVQCVTICPRTSLDILAVYDIFSCLVIYLFEMVLSKFPLSIWQKTSHI
jgi:hypothetical protein